ncbi:MAG: amidase family protein, partial [Novosphingobium sp.]
MAEASRAVQQRELSSEEYTAALMARISSLDPQLNSFVACDAEMALASARAADAEMASGRPRSPLHGIPVGIKDIIDVKGYATTCYSKFLLDNRPETDAGVVESLKSSGGIVAGKTATHEFA